MGERKTRARIRGLWKIFLVVAIHVTIILVAFFALVIYSTNIKVKTWNITKEYQEGFWSNLTWTEPKFTVKIILAIGNPSAFTVRVVDLQARLILNGTDMGRYVFPEHYWNIPPFDWFVWTHATFRVTGDDADYLESVEIYNVSISLRGHATCMFYTTRFETTYQKAYMV